MKNIILDTDIGPDCDDAGALALLNIYADRGLCRILGVGHCTSNPYGAGAIDAICRHYGRDDVAIGTWTGGDFLNDEICSRYNKPITERLPNRYKERQPEDVVRMYRRILAQQPDGGVEFVAIGPLNNLSALLDSGADDVSRYTGKELVARKVAKLTLMAGIFRPSDEDAAAEAERRGGKHIEEFAEYNVMCDVTASRNVADNWPTPKSYIGWEAGLMETGDCFADESADHPVRMAYELWNGGRQCRRCSWDLMTVMYAVEKGSPCVRDSAAGWIRFTAEGYTHFTADENGSDHFGELAMDESGIAKYINDILASRI